MTLEETNFLGQDLQLADFRGFWWVVVETE
jgi:hypothetical protein